MNVNKNRGIQRAIVASSVLLTLASVTAVPQSAEAQYTRQNGGWGRDRYNQQGRQQRSYGDARISFDWDLNGFTVRDQSSLEAQIRRDLEADAASLSQNGTRDRNRGRYDRDNRSGRTYDTNGTLEVNVAFKRLNRNTVQAEVRLGWNQDGRGAAGVTATESATTPSTDNSVDGQVVLQAFRRARREFAPKVNQYQRSNDNGYSNGNGNGRDYNRGNGYGYGNRSRSDR